MIACRSDPDAALARYTLMQLIQILQGVATVLVALLAGSMLFFSFVMAPLIFIKLDIDVAGKFVRAVSYYLLILILAGLGTLTLVAFAPLNAGLMALIAASTAYCRQYLMPRINEYRDRSRAGEAGTTEVFDKLHRRSEVLNGCSAGRDGRAAASGLRPVLLNPA